MNLYKNILTLGLLLLTYSCVAQKWHKIFDPIEDQKFILVDENEDGTIAVLTCTEDPKFTILNQEGLVLNEIDFVFPVGPFRFYNYIALGSGEYAVLCRSVFSNPDEIRVIKFNQNGDSDWVQDLSNDNYKVRPHALSILDNGNIVAMGIAELKLNSNNNQEIFMYELDPTDGSEISGFFVDTDLQYSTGIRLEELSNGNYLCLEAQMTSNQINAFGGMSLKSFFLNEITKDGVLVKHMEVENTNAGDPFQNRLNIFAPDSVFLVTNREVFLFNEQLDLIWRSQTDLRIEDVVFDLKKNVIAMTGTSYTGMDYEGASILLMNFAGEIISSKTFGTTTRGNSSADEYGIDQSDNGYILANGRSTGAGSGQSQLECLRTDSMGSIDNYNVFDIYSTCSDYQLAIPDFNPPINDCGEIPEVTTYKSGSIPDLNCVFNTLSKRLQSVVHLMTDSCGNVDSTIQVIHYEVIEPSISCCDFTILSQDSNGATIQFAPVTVTIDATCTQYDLSHLDDYDINEPYYFTTGIHTVNFLLQNNDCNYMKSIYKSFNIEIVFVDEDGDGFEASVDCDDNNANVNPDAEEIPYNGLDDDCDEITLDDDLDQDGFVLADDCDDQNDAINLGQEEEVYNGIDDDCDETTLDDDLDQDGFVLADDCDDQNSDIYPGATEIPNNNIDEDCDGEDLVLSTFEIGNAKIEIFPNPASEFIYVEVEGKLNFAISLVDMNGRTIISGYNLKTIDLTNFIDGVYLLTFEDLDSHKLVVEKIVVMK